MCRPQTTTAFQSQELRTTSTRGSWCVFHMLVASPFGPWLVLRTVSLVLGTEAHPFSGGSSKIVDVTVLYTYLISGVRRVRLTVSPVFVSRKTFLPFSSPLTIDFLVSHTILIPNEVHSGLCRFYCWRHHCRCSGTGL